MARGLAAVPFAKLGHFPAVADRHFQTTDRRHHFGQLPGNQRCLVIGTREVSGQREVLFNNACTTRHRCDGYQRALGVVRVAHGQAECLRERVHGRQIHLGECGRVLRRAMQQTDAVPDCLKRIPAAPELPDIGRRLGKIRIADAVRQHSERLFDLTQGGHSR
ncbi:hypothetical protein D3C72_1830330 [compost metagenome]